MRNKKIEDCKTADEVFDLINWRNKQAFLKGGKKCKKVVFWNVFSWFNTRVIGASLEETIDDHKRLLHGLAQIRQDARQDFHDLRLAICQDGAIRAVPDYFRMVMKRRYLTEPNR